MLPVKNIKFSLIQQMTKLKILEFLIITLKNPQRNPISSENLYAEFSLPTC